MTFSPFARFRNFTLTNLKSLLELYPDSFDSLTWDEAGNIIETRSKGYKKTAYQQACQFGLEDRSDPNNFRIQNYLYTFEDDNLLKYLGFWAYTYFAPNPYVNSHEEPILIFCEAGHRILESPNLEMSYDDFFGEKMGGGSQDILLNVLRNYCKPLKYKKIDGDNILFIEKDEIDHLNNLISFIEKEFPVANSKDRSEFFDRYSYKSFCKFYGTNPNEDLDNVENNLLNHVNNVNKTKDKVGYNKIFYGIPGCGKSYHVENKVLKDVNKKDNVFRTTFYLDYSNSDFIGQIYPHVEDEKVTYEPIPGPFTKALERALSTDEMVYLVIEEINRGNAAAIFGDTFQLLDRLKKDNTDGRLVGDSEYPISNAFIEGYFDKRNKDIEKSGGVNKIKFTKGRIIIPHNLTILATMNTSDQNVFPLDTAFKRRWDREKVVTEWSKVGDIKKMYIPCSSITWEQFATTINNKMLQESQSGDVAISEDKQMGPYFIHENMLSKVENTGTNDDLIAFVSNVLDYLYNDVTKFDHSILFDKSIISYDMLYEKMRVYDQTGNDLFEGIFKDSVEKALVDVSVIEEPQDDDVEEESLEEPNE
ncbi:AAA family ATPase [Catenibacterium mitsuokai]|uniref:AAA family ATPase n=1 Tax=Catenibacterium mitsuokai TaxID=100886 RepID=UPI003F92032C